MIKQIADFDAGLSWRLTLAPRSMWRQTAAVVAHVGDGPYVFGAVGFVYLLGWLFDDPFLRYAEMAVAIEVLAAMGLVTLIKFSVRRERPRPPGEFVTFHYDIYSFPSGHAARLAALATGTMIFYPVPGAILWVITLAVAAARVAVGVHYVSDVIVGLGVGALVARGTTAILPLLPIPFS